MSEEEINEMINEYFDGELDKNKEPILFTYLSKYDESREYFKNLSRIKESLKQSVEEFPQELEERILLSVESIAKTKDPVNAPYTNWYTIISYSFAVILLIVSIFLFNLSSDYKHQLELTTVESNYQKQVIHLMYNSLPAAEVVSPAEDQVVIMAEM